MSRTRPVRALPGRSGFSVCGAPHCKLVACTSSRRADAAATLQNPLQETVDLRIADLGTQPGVVHRQAAALLVEGFDHPRGWPDPESATMEVERVLHEGFALGALEDALLLGWIGGLPEYDGRVWELHPLVVRRNRRLRGVGRALVAAFEDEARRRGAPPADLTSTCPSQHGRSAESDDPADRILARLSPLAPTSPFSPALRRTPAPIPPPPRARAGESGRGRERSRRFDPA